MKINFRDGTSATIPDKKRPQDTDKKCECGQVLKDYETLTGDTCFKCIRKNNILKNEIHPDK